MILKYYVIFCVSNLHQASQHADDGNNYDGQMNTWYIHFEEKSIFIYLFIFRSPHFENLETEM